MIVYQRTDDDICVIAMEGRLEHMEVAAVERDIRPFLMDKAIKGVIINCQKLITIDSRGVGLLLGSYKLLQEREAEFAVCYLNQNNYDILDMVGLSEVFHIRDTEEEAIQLINEKIRYPA